MKKLFAIAALCIGFAFTSTAQISKTTLHSATGYSKDTVTSATAKYLYYTNPNTNTGLIVGKQTIYVVASGLEISGTTSGTIRIEASADSSTWYPYYTGTPEIDSAAGNLRLTLSDVTTKQAIRWILPNFGDRYIRVVAAGGGTTNWSVEGAIWGKP